MCDSMASRVAKCLVVPTCAIRQYFMVAQEPCTIYPNMAIPILAISTQTPNRKLAGSVSVRFGNFAAAEIQ